MKHVSTGKFVDFAEGRIFFRTKAAETCTFRTDKADGWKKMYLRTKDGNFVTVVAPPTGSKEYKVNLQLLGTAFAPIKDGNYIALKDVVNNKYLSVSKDNITFDVSDKLGSQEHFEVFKMEQ